jgi:copper chaperone NosL
VSWRRALSLSIPFVMLALAACQKESVKTPAPQEYSKDTVAEFCGMGLAEHPGPKAQIFVRGLPNPRWFASVHDAFAYTMLQETPKDIAAIYVNDMGKAKNWEHPEPGTWIEARKAIYVIESRKRGGMDQNEAVPFSSREAAEAFAKEEGGRLVSFEEIPKSYILASAEPGPPASNDGLNRDSESAHDRTENDAHSPK